jgi:hypothetical protein
MVPRTSSGSRLIRSRLLSPTPLPLPNGSWPSIRSDLCFLAVAAASMGGGWLGGGFG